MGTTNWEIASREFADRQAAEKHATAKHHLLLVLQEFKIYKESGFPEFEATTYYTFFDYPDLTDIYWRVASRFPELFDSNGNPLAQETVLNREIQITVTVTTESFV